MENRNGIEIDFRMGQATGRAEWDTGRAGNAACAWRRAPDQDGWRPRLRHGGARGELPRAQYPLHTWCRTSAEPPARRSFYTTGLPGYTVSQRVRKWVEEIFGWINAGGSFRRTPLPRRGPDDLRRLSRGRPYNLLRIAKFCPAGRIRLAANSIDQRTFSTTDRQNLLPTQKSHPKLLMPSFHQHPCMLTRWYKNQSWWCGGPVHSWEQNPV